MIRWLRRIAWRLYRTQKRGRMALLLAHANKLKERRDDLMQEGWFLRREMNYQRERADCLSVQLAGLDINDAAKRPAVYGTYLVYLANGSTWHEAKWTADGWAVSNRVGRMVTHWRRMPPAPAKAKVGAA